MDLPTSSFCFETEEGCTETRRYLRETGRLVNACTWRTTAEITSDDRVNPEE